MTELFLSLPYFKLCDVEANPFELEEPLAASIVQIYQKIYDEYHSGHPDQTELISSYFHTLLLLIKRLKYSFAIAGASAANTDRVSRNRHNGMLVKKFLLLINNGNYSIEEQDTPVHSVNYYARQLNLNPNYLNAVVRKETGRTAHELIMDHVIAFARILLLQTDLNIKEIAYRLTFCDTAHFSKVFKKCTSYSPKAFRAIHRG